VSRLLLLLPSETYRARDFLDAASRLDAEVVVASDHRQALAGALGDRALRVNLGRPEAAAQAIVELAQRTPLDAVVAVDDQGILVAALAAERLGLAHNPPDAVAATRNKTAMRDAFASAALPQPAFRVVDDDAQVSSLAGEVGFPCVVKPVSLSASRGVIRADSPEQAERAATRIREILRQAGEDPAGPLLVEQYIPGAEVAVEGMLRSGELEIVAFFDKPDPLEGPYFEETIYVTPSRLPTSTLTTIGRLTSEAVAALGLVEGPVHAELRIDGERAWLLELAARSIGGLCSRSLRFGLGASFEELILRRALGLPLERLTREQAASGVMMLPIPRSGVLQEIAGQDEALAVDGVTGLEVSIAFGKRVQPLPEGDRYLGFIFARGETAGEVEQALRVAHSRLDIVIVERSAG